MNNYFDKVYYEPDVLKYDLGKQLKEKFDNLEWVEIESHNRINELSSCENKEFTTLKQHLIIGTRKTHKYVENHKVSDYLVPFTSSGCRAMCLYCYLVCNYNKCSYLRLFVNREEMMDKLIKKSVQSNKDLTFEIGSNSDLVLENTITHNLEWAIPIFAEKGKGFITFPTKFDMVDPLLKLNHNGKIIFRMSVNPQKIIKTIEIGTSGLLERINALNKMAEAGYITGILIAPVILTDDWEKLYCELIETLENNLSDKIKRKGFIEVIFMTYSYVQNAINNDAFKNIPLLLDKNIMTGRGRGKYCYKQDVRYEAEGYIKLKLKECLPDMKIIYIV